MRRRLQCAGFPDYHITLFIQLSMGILSSAFVYRGFILGSVKREFQSKYRNSVLGIVWTLLNPLATIAVYTLIFSQVMRSRMPGAGHSEFSYSIYLCSGVLTWGLFADILGRSQNVFLEHANLIKKINFPRICLPIIVVCNACLNFAIIFGLFTLFLIMVGQFPGWIYFAIFPVLAVQIVFAIGLGIILGVLNVFFRDVGQFFGIMLQFWFWLTPVVYPITILSERIRAVVAWNPVTPMITAYQSILVEGQSPPWENLMAVACAGILLCGLGMLLFRRRVGEMVDEL
jgi:lipopolysaccharide transport system permease protein